MNLGFFIGFASAGYFQLQANYSALFLFAAIGNIATIILSVLIWPQLEERNTPLEQVTTKQFYQRFALGITILVLLVPLLRGLLTQAKLSNTLVVSLSILMLFILCWITARHPHASERSKMIAYLLLTLGSLVLWSLYQLAPMGLVLFAERNINLQVLGWQVAPQ